MTNRDREEVKAIRALAHMYFENLISNKTLQEELKNLKEPELFVDKS